MDALRNIRKSRLYRNKFQAMEIRNKELLNREKLAEEISVSENTQSIDEVVKNLRYLEETTGNSE